MIRNWVIAGRRRVDKRPLWFRGGSLKKRAASSKGEKRLTLAADRKKGEERLQRRDSIHLSRRRSQSDESSGNAAG
jgi:hypothetical protein